jgi:hypothetical protein
MTNAATYPVDGKPEAKAQYWRDQAMLARSARDASNATNGSLRAALADILATVNMSPAGKERQALELIADRVVAEGL